MDQNQTWNVGMSQAQVSERNFLSTVYLWMSLGLMMTGFVAMWLAVHPHVVIQLMRNSLLFFTLVIVQFGIVIALSSAIGRMGAGTATFWFGVYALLNGVIFSSIFLVYTAVSIASTFFVTAGTFAAFSLYGYSTKKDLGAIGGYLTMALIGLVLASLVNLFFHNSFFYWVSTYAGVLIFVGLTAYDTQRLKRLHQQGFQSGEALQKTALLGALILYLDFINLFLFLLRLFGRQRD